ncbi:MAG: hypothetical protein ACLT1J_08165 [Mediterraneibacter gnavus]
MDELQSGILFLQMERGTGKTTLSRMLDGRYAGNVRQKDLNAIVRAYYVGDLRLYYKKHEESCDWWCFVKETYSRGVRRSPG